MSFPTPDEIKRWVTDTIRHSWHIEYYLQRLQVGVADLQRPHDIIGFGNKLEWPAIRGFAMQYRFKEKEPDDFFSTYVLPALWYHRQQDHHVAWNEFSPSSSVDSMKLGAVDACCSLLEPRGYQGGCHTWDEIEDISLKNPIHKTPWMLLMAQEMKKVEKPILTPITLTNVPRKGLTPESHDIITGRISETLAMLKQDHNITLD
jgi:hypothetical protein